MTTDARQRRAGAATGRHGLTLVELLTAIVIIGLLLGLSVGLFVRMRRGASSDALQDRLTTVFRLARANAMAGGPGGFIVLYPQDAFENASGDSPFPVGGVQSFRFTSAAAWHCDQIGRASCRERV